MRLVKALTVALKTSRPSTRARAIQEGYRSGLEVEMRDILEKKGLKPFYEAFTLEYLQPAKRRHYTPDFLLTTKTTVTLKQIYDGKVTVIETNGRFTLEDRQKHLWLKEQYPQMDLRFVFTNPNGKISKGSKTSYGMWCDKHKFKYFKKVIPPDWFAEM